MCIRDRRRRVVRQAGVVHGDVAHVGVAEVGDQRGHRARRHVAALVFLQLPVEVFRMLAGQVGEERRDGDAFGAVAGAADLGLRLAGDGIALQRLCLLYTSRCV